jgi:hypothetical protein
MPDDPTKPPAEADLSKAIDKLKSESRDLRERIEEEKRRQAMPLDSHLGDPEWEQKAKDGRFDRPADEDED